MLGKCPHLDESQMTELIEHSQQTPLHKIRIYLHQRKDEYLKCFQIYLENSGISVEIFEWIDHILW